MNRAARLCLAVLLCLGVGFPAAASAAGEAVEGTDFPCTATLPQAYAEYAWRLTDGLVNSRIRFGATEELRLSFRGDPAALLLEWYEPPAAVNVSIYDASGAPLSEIPVADGALGALIPLPLGVCSAVIAGIPSTDGGDTAGFILSEYRLLDAAEAADMRLPAVAAETDLMLVCAHTGEELTAFSGLLPALTAGRGISTVTVFLSHKNRQAQQDAINAALHFGEPNQPEFLGQQYFFLTESKYARVAKDFWKREDVLPQLVETIRRCRPKVVVTHAAKGETDAMCGWTASLVKEAVSCAASAFYYPASAEQYGTWQVQKVYCADPDGAVRIETDAPLPAMGGVTAGALAQEALDGYASIALLRPSLWTELRFSLSVSTVGEDTTPDFFDNLPAAQLVHGGISPTPLPTATPEPTEAPPDVLTDSPITATAATLPAIPADAPDSAQNGHFLPSYLPALGGLVLGALLFFLLRRAKPSLRIALALLAVLCGVGGSLLIARRAGSSASAPVAALTPAADGELLPTSQTLPAETPAPTATEAASEVPDADLSTLDGDTPSIASEDSKFAAYFASGDEELVTTDVESGHWEYRSSTLCVQIERKCDESLPMVWYVAHIYARDIDPFRPGFGYYNLRGSATDAPWRIARKAKAVLAVTGDNLSFYEVDIKGFLIRNGRVYHDTDATDTMALCPDLSLRIYKKGSVAVQDVLDDGVENTYGFGPVLVENGAANTDAADARLHMRNPRTGFGMVEPGHFVAVTVDGRLAGHSVGATLAEFMQIFVDEGCSVAYNLDGGASTCMVFMGEAVTRSRRQRKWPDGLLIGYSDLVPDVTDPVANTGMG